MCVNCFGSVDAMAWGATGTTATILAVHHQIRGRLVASSSNAQQDLAIFVADIRSNTIGRRLSGEDDKVVPFVLALVSYVLAGLVLKSIVLNWIVGPLYLVAAVHLVPVALRRLAGAVRA